MAKKLGLTEAMRRTLSNIDGDRRMMERLCELGLIAWNNEGAGQDGWHRTPRGQAALAAPRVTAAELVALVEIQHKGKCSAYRYKHQIAAIVFNRMHKAGWIAQEDMGADEVPIVVLTPAGTTALNNVRAASGSADYKEN